MKRLFTILAVTVLLLTGCGKASNGDYDINLIAGDIFDPSMIYSLAVQIVQEPKDYVDKTVGAEGIIFDDIDGVKVIEIADTKGCCYQNVPVQLGGLENQVQANEVYNVYGIFKLDDSGKVYIAVDKMERSTLYDLDLDAAE